MISTTTLPDRSADRPAPRGGGGRVVFQVCRTLPIPTDEAWRRLVDWAGHATWIPMTRVDVDPADPNRFVAWSGIGPVMLEDRMEAVEQHFDGASGRCRVLKLGPVLVGEAEFAVFPGLTPGSSVVQWREDVTVRRLPRFLTSVASVLGGRLFAGSLARMVRHG
jgi:hypothetical protein